MQAALELDLASLDKRVSAADWDGRMISEIKAIRKYRYWRVLTGQTYEVKTKRAGAALIMFFLIQITFIKFCRGGVRYTVYYYYVVEVTFRTSQKNYAVDVEGFFY